MNDPRKLRHSDACIERQQKAFDEATIPNPTKTPLRERMAVMMRWKRIDPPMPKVDYPDVLLVWESPWGFMVPEDELPFFDTDDGTALGALEEFQNTHRGIAVSVGRAPRAPWVAHIYHRTETDLPDGTIDQRERRFEGRHESLARAICDAMLAAVEGMK